MRASHSSCLLGSAVLLYLLEEFVPACLYSFSSSKPELDLGLGLRHLHIIWPLGIRIDFLQCNTAIFLDHQW